MHGMRYYGCSDCYTSINLVQNNSMGCDIMVVAIVIYTSINLVQNNSKNLNVERKQNVSSKLM